MEARAEDILLWCVMLILGVDTYVQCLCESVKLDNILPYIEMYNGMRVLTRGAHGCHVEYPR